MNRKSFYQEHEATCIATIGSPGVTVRHFPHVHDRHCYSSPCPNRINITVTALWVATPLLSTFSVAAVCVAVSTNQWLITQENIKNGNYTGKGDQEYFPKNTISGLWTLCYTNQTLCPIFSKFRGSENTREKAKGSGRYFMAFERRQKGKFRKFVLISTTTFICEVSNESSDSTEKKQCTILYMGIYE
ncbi:hypothetical protein RUM43_004886 [Polyplax serrata]|uniref:Uncharacterized protein n=1 Tax=Polyplax serrata TaxID=468196 RepID=A0AAN8SE31_POLSC